MSTVSSSMASAASKPWYDTSDVKLGDDFYKYQAAVQEDFLNFFTPLNMTMFILVLTLLYIRLRPIEDQTPVLAADRPVTFQTFTPRTLLKFNGHRNTMNPESKVYIAVQGKVHDVTSGRNFYGPGGPYENFAGRDATRGLACQSFDEEMLTKDLDGPLDDCKDLTKEQVENLQGWAERFDEKYLVIGKLMAYNSNKSEF